MSDENNPIKLHPENPHYFSYKGKPLVLITATEHYGAVINRNFDYISYLDETVDKKGTLSRCFLLFRELQVFDSSQHLVPQNPHSPCKPLAGEYVAPFLRTGPGFASDGYPKFNLDKWNPEFFERLHGFLTEADKRDVIVELTLFSNTYHDPVWNLNPFNVRNNINAIGDIAWQDYNSMSDRATFEKQLVYVRKIVEEVKHYNNVYFEVCNEPGGSHRGHVSVAEIEAWQDAVRDVIREEEAGLTKQHMIFQMPVGHVRGYYSSLDPLVDESTIDAINLHHGNTFYKNTPLLPLGRFMERDLMLENICQLWTSFHDAGKPLLFDEDNSASNGLDEESWIIHRKRAWTTLCSGGHYDMIDFSIQVGGQENGTPASREMIRSWMKNLSQFIHSVDFIHMAPVRGFADETPDSTIAVALANPGAEYVIYVVDKRELEDEGQGEPCGGTIAFSLPGGSYEAKLYDPVSAEYTGEASRLDGGDVSLALEAFTHDIVLHIMAVK